MKKTSALLAAAVIAFQAVLLPVFAKENDNFTVVKISCPEGEEYLDSDYQKFDRLMVRYADDKTPIALSAYNDGYMFATIPKKNADREIECYLAEDKEFTDHNEDGDNSYRFYIMERVSRRGIVQGDELGRALPEKNISRAEATAMIMRFLGIDGFEDTESGFEDVAPDAWYAGVVTSARKAGLISGESETIFDPQREVSREEFTVMASNAMLYAGMGKEITENAEEILKQSLDPVDHDDVSEWAISAYAGLNTSGIYDYVFPEEFDDETGEVYYYLYPKQPATRYEACELINRVCERRQIYPTQAAEEYGFDKEMPVIDGSTSTYPFTQAVYSVLFGNGYMHPDMPSGHSKSHASYQRLINGEVDVIVASVYPSEDIVQMAEEKGVELEMVPIAYDAMIFFTNADNSAEGLTKEQISEIYVENKYKNWKEIGGPDALLYPYCRNNDSGSHAQMQKHFLNGNEINDEIRRESTSVAMADVLTDVMDAQTDDPEGYALGYSIYYYFHNMNDFYETESLLKLLSIDGVYPTDETIADGSYPLSNNTYVVFNAAEPEGSKARRFAEFMLSDKGQECVELAGFGPLAR